MMNPADLKLFDCVTIDGTDCFYELKNDTRWPYRAEQLVNENLVQFVGPQVAADPPADNGPRFPDRITIEPGNDRPSYTTEIASHLRGKWCRAVPYVAAQVINSAVVDKWSNVYKAVSTSDIWTNKSYPDAPAVTVPFRYGFDKSPLWEVIDDYMAVDIATEFYRMELKMTNTRTASER